MFRKSPRALESEINNDSFKKITVWCSHISSSDFKICDLFDISTKWLSFLLDTTNNNESDKWIHNIKLWDNVDINFKIWDDIITTKWVVRNILSKKRSDKPRCWIEFDWLGDKCKTIINEIIKVSSE